MSLLSIAGSTPSDSGFELKSVRFDEADAAFLSKTFASAGNQKTFTISVWTKRGDLGISANIFCPTVGGDGSNERQFGLQAADDLRLYDSGGNRGMLTTTQLFRDPSAWYHIVVAVDTTQGTEANRAKIYINGDLVTAYSGTITQNTDFDFNHTKIINSCLECI